MPSLPRVLARLMPSSGALRGSGAGPRGSRPLWRHPGRGGLEGAASGATPPPTPARPGEVGGGGLPLLPSRGLGPFRPPHHPARHLECPGLVVGGRRSGWGPRDETRESPVAASARAADSGDGRLFSSPPLGGAHLRGVSVSYPRAPAPRPPSAKFAGRPTLRAHTRVRVRFLLSWAFPCHRLRRAPARKASGPVEAEAPCRGTTTVPRLSLRLPAPFPPRLCPQRGARGDPRSLAPGCSRSI